MPEPTFAKIASNSPLCVTKGYCDPLKHTKENSPRDAGTSVPVTEKQRARGHAESPGERSGRSAHHKLKANLVAARPGAKARKGNEQNFSTKRPTQLLGVARRVARREQKTSKMRWTRCQRPGICSFVSHSSAVASGKCLQHCPPNCHR